MLWRRIIVLTVSLLMLLSSACLAEEDMEFVDANGATGYYVDVASISFESDDIANVWCSNMIRKHSWRTARSRIRRIPTALLRR